MCWNVLKMPWRRAEDENFLSWGSLEDDFSTSWRPINVCWVILHSVACTLVYSYILLFSVYYVFATSSQKRVIQSIINGTMNVCENMYSWLSISQIVDFSNFLESGTNVLVPWQTTEANKYSVSPTLDISNSFLNPLGVRDIESQLYCRNKVSSIICRTLSLYRRLT